MAFVIASQPGLTLGRGGSSLGLGPPLGSFIAVEMDIYQGGNDPNNNHVGLDVNSADSVATGNPAFTMASEVPFSVWVDYDGGTNSFQVYTAQNSSIKPQSPTLSTTYNISTALLPVNSSSGYFMGFTSATGGDVAQFNVLSWCFTMGECIAMHSCTHAFSCIENECRLDGTFRTFSPGAIQASLIQPCFMAMQTKVKHCPLCHCMINHEIHGACSPTYRLTAPTLFIRQYHTIYASVSQVVYPSA